MEIIKSRTAYYPSFTLGSAPGAIECQLAIVEANGRKYLKTPFAMLDAHGEDDHDRAVRPPCYYATADEAEAYLENEYPWWKQAYPIMEKLLSARRNEGDIVGPSRLANKLDVAVDNLYRLARGHKGYTLKQVKIALSQL